MEIKIKTNNHIGSQLINICKKLGVEFTVGRDGSFEYVDLGLPSGLKWAKCNVGAKTPTEYGKYFYWGEVVDACLMGNIVYDHDSPFEDAATYHMGKAWRMPTKEEFKELYDNTTSKWVKNYQGSGVNGRLFISNVNGETLFFPAAGRCYDGSFSNVGSGDCMWSSSLYSDNFYRAWHLNFGSGYVGMYYDSRCNGFSVRGVKH